MSAAPPHSSKSPHNGDGKHSPFVDLHLNFLEPGPRDELIDLGGGAAAHNPRLAFAVAQHARDKLELRMPRLVGVDPVTAGHNCVGEPGERFGDDTVAGK